MLGLTATSFRYGDNFTTEPTLHNVVMQFRRRAASRPFETQTVNDAVSPWTLSVRPHLVSRPPLAPSVQGGKVAGAPLDFATERE